MSNRPDGAPEPRLASTERDGFEDFAPAMAIQTVLLLLLATLAGVAAALFVLPHWLPGLSGSLIGDAPKGYWYLSRASAWMAFALLWLSMAMGLLITNRLARVWPGGPNAFDLHQHVSLLALAFSLFHALILLGDRYVGYSLVALLVPFASRDYRPIAVGLGQMAFYAMAVVGLSFYVRRRIGHHLWRLLHYLSFAVFLLALGHGIWSGTDSTATWARALYWSSAGSLLFLTVFRVLVSARPAASRRPAVRETSA
jgi:predicted ferric reductase